MQVITPETIAGSEAHDTDGEGLGHLERDASNGIR